MRKIPTYEELLAQNSALKKQVKTLSEKNEKLEIRNKELDANYNWILEQLKLSKKKIYGASAEKIAEEYGQLNLFNEAELEREPLKHEPELEEITYKRKKANKKTYTEKYGDLPVEEVIYDIPEEEKICSKCGSEMSFMKYEIRRELKVVPAKVTVVEHKRAVYVCRNCDKNGTKGNIITADGVPSLMEKSLASPSILAYIMNQKFCNGLPLFRQEQEFKRMDVRLSRQTMANWMISGANLLKPVYDKLRAQLAGQELIHADETPVEVLCEEGREPEAKSYMWVYRTGRYTENAVVLYKYETGRSREFANKFLKGFNGYMHCDGWAGYDKVENAKRCGCWVHLRRYFMNAKTDHVDEAGRDKVIATLKRADLGSKLEKLESGIDTELTKEFSDNGTMLSGGEAQKVAIARMFMRDMPIAILDEPSSALDPIAEYRLNKSMLENAENQAVILISHRLSTTKDADRIILLEHGCIAESGTHTELLANGGTYAEMWNVQAEKYCVGIYS